MNYILASKSPRRKEILEMLGVAFEVVTADVDESSDVTDPCRLVEILSERKGLAVRDRLLSEGRDLSDTVIISSDTVVAAGGEILGKPRDRADACRMLSMLAGRSHTVVSGISLITPTAAHTSHEVTLVTFDPLDAETIERYVDTARPYDKAGAYAIQETASLFISGSLSSVSQLKLPLIYPDIFHLRCFIASLYMKRIVSNPFSSNNSLFFLAVPHQIS